MEESVVIPPPVSEIYKVHFFNSDGKVKQTIVFSGGHVYEKRDLFSDDELRYIESEQVIILFSDFQIHPDDTVRVIKRKIIEKMRQTAYEEIYLFAKIQVRLNTKLIYDNITNSEKSRSDLDDHEISGGIFAQLANNLNIDDLIMDEMEVKQSYSYEDVLLFGLDEKETSINMAIGMKPINGREYLFSANPHDIVNTGATRYEMRPQNPILAFENDILMNYGEPLGKNLYVCLADVLFEYSFEHGIDEEYMSGLYFPLLFNRNIKTQVELENAKSELLKGSVVSKQTFDLYKTVDMFYNIYYNKTDELAYIIRGIQSFSLIFGSNRSTLIPLETVFKQLHATREMPLIKYNPGPRRENMFRIYSEAISKTGKKIPFLSESVLMRLVREMGKKRQISVYLAESDLYIDFETDGTMYVHGILKIPISKGELNALVISQIRPFVDMINRILSQPLFNLDGLNGIYDESVIVQGLKYVATVPFDKLNIKQYSACISSIFDVMSIDLKKQIQMRFKRVANYVEMDSQSETITTVLRNTNDYQEAAQMLMTNYQMTEEEAILRIAKYTSEFQELGGKIIDNPGFPLVMYAPLGKNQLVVELDGVLSFGYLDVLEIYIDSILRIILPYRDNHYPKETIKQICTRSAKLDKDADKPHTANVVVSTNISEIVSSKKIQPLNFSFEEDDDDGMFDITHLPDDLEETAVKEDILDDEVGLGEATEDGFYIEHDDIIPQIPSPQELESAEDLGETEVSAEDLGETEQSAEDLGETEVSAEDLGETEVSAEDLGETEESGQESDSDSDEDNKLVFEYDEEEEEEDAPNTENDLANITLQSAKKIEEEEDDDVEDNGSVLEEDDVDDDGFVLEYDDEDEDDEDDKLQHGGEDTPDSPSTQTHNIDGLSLYPNPFLKRLKERDTTLFLTKKEGKYNSYSRACPANISRQPIILTDEEKAEIDRTNPGSYNHPVKYGSDPNNQFWYICPKYWCMLTNSSITEADVKAGKCGGIIPSDAKKVPKGSYVYEFNSRTKEHVNANGEYIEHYPGFIPDSHPSGHCLPCCFKLRQNAKTQEWEMSKEQLKLRNTCIKKEEEADAKRPAKGAPKIVSYIKSSAIVPLEPTRWGFLSMALQLFLKTDNSAAVQKTNSAAIKPDTPCLLRYGVEQVRNQSFLGCVAEMYAYKQNLKRTPSVSELRNILVDSLTIDLYITYHQGSLITVFKPETVELDPVEISKYQDSVLVKTSKKNRITQDFLLNIIASYHRFREFLLDDTSPIDHTYLWDMVTGYNQKLMKDGINLVIIEAMNNDITNKVEIICPTNSKIEAVYDPRKETVIILKQDEFYEPIYLYEERKGKIHEFKAFIDKPTTLAPIVELLNLVKNVNQSQCLGKPSIPRLYEFESNISAEQLRRELISIQYTVVKQIMNYQGKIIGLMALSNGSDIAVFIPSLPSRMINDIDIQYMDSEDLWQDLDTTITRLKQLYVKSQHKIPCLPRIKVMEEGLIVGIITNTNQFVQIAPPSENIASEADGLSVIDGTNWNEADRTIVMGKQNDQERETMIKKISLESNFFSAFRRTVQNTLNKYENRAIRKTLLEILNVNNRVYRQKLEMVIALLRQILEKEIRFIEFKETDLIALDDITHCSSNCADPTKTFCLREERDGEEHCIMLIPNRHLISDKKNEPIYYARIADELIRYKRIRRFMFSPSVQLNVTDTEYKINTDEFLVLQSILNGGDYFTDLIPFNANQYVGRINFDMAEPNTTQSYSNEISLLEQTRILTQNVFDKTYNNLMSECILKQDKVVGNIQNSMWKRIFPVATEEVVFKPTVFCSFYPIIQIFQERLGTAISIQNLKAFLWKGYSKLVNEFGDKIIEILKYQGKKDMMDRIVKKRTTLDAVIFSEEYYITDLDLWILARDASLPVVIFSSTKLNQLRMLIDWILLGGNENDYLHFIRTPAKVVDNTPPEYHLIMGKYKYIDLKEFRGVMQGAIENREEDEHLISLEKYFNIKRVLIKRKVVKQSAV